MENIKLPFNEVDYIVPTETFTIEYTYLSKQGFSFTKEYLLRLLNIEPLSKSEVASFFGFSKRELEAVIDEPVSKGEITYQTDGKLILTALAKGYFSSLDSVPLIEKPRAKKATLSFELTGFNRVNNKHDDWYVGLKIDVNREIQCISESHAKNQFRLQFQRLVTANELGSFNQTDDALPSLYSIDKVTKKKTIAHRIKRNFEIDLDNKITPFYLNKRYENDEVISQSIFQSTDDLRLSDNFDCIRSAWDAFQDMSVSRYIMSNEIDFRGILGEMSTYGAKPYELLIGSLYSKQFINKVEPLIEQLKPSKQKDKIRQLKWLGANNRYWGASDSFVSAKNMLLSNQTNKNGNNYTMTLYLSSNDHPKIKEQAKSEWKQRLGDLSSCECVRDGLFNGCVEVMLLDNEFAAVSYHLAMPDISPVPIPLGFMTKDKELIQKISRVVTDFLDGSQAHDKPNLIGNLK